MHDRSRNRLKCNVTLHEEFFGVVWMTFTGTIWTFKPVVALSEPAQRVMSDNVTAGHHHRRIVIGSLLFGHRADENGVKVVGWG